MPRAALRGGGPAGQISRSRKFTRRLRELSDGSAFVERSVATTGTHDTEPLAATPEGETEEQRIAIVQSLLSAGSCLTLIPLQDVFGWTDRGRTVPALKLLKKGDPLRPGAVVEPGHQSGYVHGECPLSSA